MRKFAFLMVLALCCAFSASLQNINYNTFGTLGTLAWNTTNLTDTLWARAVSGVGYTYAFSSDSNGSLLYAWSIAYDTVTSPTFPITGIVKRTLNATIAATANGTTESATYGTDTTVTPSSTVSTSGSGNIITAGGPGYFGFLTTGEDSSTAEQVYVGVIQSNGTTFNSKAVTTTPLDRPNPTGTGPYYTTTHTPVDIWYDSGIFYFLWWTQVNQGMTGSYLYKTSTLYLQGVYANNGTTYFTTGDVVVGQVYGSAPSSTPVAHSGNTEDSNSSSLYIVYKDTPVTLPSDTEPTFLLTIAKTTANPTITAQLLAHDVPSLLTYTPAGVIVTNYTTGAALNLYNQTSGATDYTCVLFLNGSTTGVDSGFYLDSSLISVQAWAFGSGFILFGLRGTEYSYQTYNTDATVSTGMVTFASAGTSGLFEDGAGYVWFWYIGSGLGPDGAGYQGLVARFGGELISGPLSDGTLAGTTNGNILSALFVLISTVIGSLFIF